MTTNLKTKNNQNCQKIEQYGSLTTQELRKKHSSRLVGGAENASPGKENWGWRGCSWWTGWSPHLRVDKPGGTTVKQERPCNPGFQCREIKPQNL